MAATVRPALVDPMPVVMIDLGTNFDTYRSIWDFPVPGSPTISM